MNFRDRGFFFFAAQTSHTKGWDIMTHRNSVDCIDFHLKALMLSLGWYEQTTHGCLGPFTIETVAAALIKAHNEPSSYNISTLSQNIQGFLNVPTST